MIVVVPPCQEPCCRKRRGERPVETPSEIGKRIADKAFMDPRNRPGKEAGR